MRIRNTVLLFLLLQLHVFCGSAQCDSLLHEFKGIPKTAGNIATLIDVSYNLVDYNVDSALSCAYQIQQIVIPANASELQCKVLLNLGNLTKISGKYNEANKFLSESLGIAEKNNIVSAKIIILYEIGDLNRCIGLLDQSLYYLYSAKFFAHKNKVSLQYPEMYDHISSAFYELTEHTHPNFKLTTIPNQNEFSLTKSTAGDFAKLCKIYADSALLLSEINKDNRTKLSCLNILGAYYRQQHNSDKAIEYFQKAIKLATRMNYKTDIPNYYINIARTYFAKKQYEKAIEYGLKAYQMAMDLNILVYKSTAAHILHVSYIEIKDYKNALSYTEIEGSTREEMNSQQNWNTVTELDKKYQSEQKQKEIEYQKTLLDLKNTEVFWRNIIIAVMILAFIVIGIGIIYIQKQKTVLFKQKEEIAIQYERLETLDQFKESLTHALVHDLKNPLSQILINTSNQNVCNAARKMLQLVMNMLDVEKYETTKFKLNKEIHSLRYIVEEVKNGQELSLREKNLVLNFHFDDFLVLTDKDIMIRVFDNLLSNALRFSPQNSSIDVFAEKSGDDIIHIGVKNYGEPIPEDSLPYIFDKYRQFEQPNSRSHRSTGMGLTFCKMAVEAHGQNIKAENLNNGVMFSFSLTGKINPQQQHDSEIEKPTIVLTQDEKALLKPFFEQLKNIGVHQVSDILQVLNKIPDTSENIHAMKEQIRDAGFACNMEFYNQLIHHEIS